MSTVLYNLQTAESLSNRQDISYKGKKSIGKPSQQTE